MVRKGGTQTKNWVIFRCIKKVPSHRVFIGFSEGRYETDTVTQSFAGFNEGRYLKHIILYKNWYRHTEFKGNL